MEVSGKVYITVQWSIGTSGNYCLPNLCEVWKPELVFRMFLEMEPKNLVKLEDILPT